MGNEILAEKESLEVRKTERHAEIVNFLLEDFKSDPDKRRNLINQVLFGLRSEFTQNDLDNYVPDKEDCRDVLNSPNEVQQFLGRLWINNESNSDNTIAKIAVGLARQPRVMTLIREATSDLVSVGGNELEDRFLKVKEFLLRYPLPDDFLVWQAEKMIYEQEMSPDVQVAHTERQLRLIKVLVDSVYGNRAEYWKEWQALVAEMKVKDAEHSAQPENRDVAHDENSSFFESVEEKDRRALLNRVVIHGSEFNERVLTKEILRENGLGPQFAIPMEGSESFFVSQPYDLGGDRLAVVLYVPQDSQLVARSYYLSNSSGMWRYLPGYFGDGYGGIAHYDKGHSEESITAPAIFQRALAEVSTKISALSVQDPEEIFAGTVRPLHTMFNGTYMSEVSHSPQRVPGNFYQEKTDEKGIPETLDFSEESWKPDFTQAEMSWQQSSNHYGLIDIDVFSAKNGQCSYMFCRDQKGRAWIGSIEPKGEVGSTGLKKEWIYGGDLTTPADEYMSQAAGYGNIRMWNGNYVDMYENYLSKIPIILEYQASVKDRNAQESKGKTKEVSFADLLSGADSFDRLFVLLNQIPILPGDRQALRGEQWVVKIEKVVAGELTIDYITRACGLQGVVRQLLTLKQVRDKITRE